MPYAWASDDTFVVERFEYTFRDRLNPFKPSRSSAGFYLCGTDNTACRPIEMPDGLDSALPMPSAGGV